MNKNPKALNPKELLGKNPQAAEIFESNQKKIAGNYPEPDEYSLGLPYGQAINSADDCGPDINELDA